MVSEDRKRRLERYLDGAAAERRERQREAEAKEAKRQTFHEGFRQVRNAVIRPALESLSVTFKERGLGAEIEVDDSPNSCAIRLRLQPGIDIRAELGFRADYWKRAVRVGRVVGRFREVSSVGVHTAGALVGEFELKDVTPDFVGAQLDEFIDLMLRACERE